MALFVTLTARLLERGTLCSSCMMLFTTTILACRFRRTFGILILVFLLFLWGSGSISLLSTICISGFLVTKCLDVFCLLVSVGCCCPIFLWYYETLPLFLCGKKMSLSLLSGKYLNFLAPLARLNNGLPRVKSKSLITCVICSRVVSSLELFGVHLLRTWNKSERWCHSLNIRQGPSRLPFAVNQ